MLPLLLRSRPARNQDQISRVIDIFPPRFSANGIRDREAADERETTRKFRSLRGIPGFPQKSDLKTMIFREQSKKRRRRKIYNIFFKEEISFIKKKR